MLKPHQRLGIIKGCAVIFAISLALPILAHAAVPSTYTNDNIFMSTHDAPRTITREGNGFYGYTVSGKLFRQYPVLQNSGIQLHRFEIDEAYFFMSDRGLIVANTNLEALSIYHARTT